MTQFLDTGDLGKRGTRQVPRTVRQTVVSLTRSGTLGTRQDRLSMAPAGLGDLAAPGSLASLPVLLRVLLPGCYLD